MTRTEVKISGYGGQGVITLGMLITSTAIMNTENIAAAQSESYGAAARGGACWTEVVLDDETEEIDYPRTVPKNVDVGIFLTDAAVGKYLGEVKKKGGVIIYDPTSISKIRAKKAQSLYSVPAQKMAREEIKNTVTANVIMFGAFIALTEVLDKGSALNGVKNFVPAKAIDINVKAFNAGYDYAMKLKESA